MHFRTFHWKFMARNIYSIGIMYHIYESPYSKEWYWWEVSIDLPKCYWVITANVSYQQCWSQYCPNFLYCQICFANPSDIWCKASGHVALTHFPLDRSHQLLSCSWNYEKFKGSQWWVARHTITRMLGKSLVQIWFYCIYLNILLPTLPSLFTFVHIYTWLIFVTKWKKNKQFVLQHK